MVCYSRVCYSINFQFPPHGLDVNKKKSRLSVYSGISAVKCTSFNKLAWRLSFPGCIVTREF